jgi:hypothetical protein
LGGLSLVRAALPLVGQRLSHLRLDLALVRQPVALVFQALPLLRWLRLPPGVGPLFRHAHTNSSPNP